MKKFVVVVLSGLFCAGTICAQHILMSGTDGLISWEITDDVLIISGDGVMRDYDSDHFAPWSDWSDDIQKVVIAEGVTFIGDNAFYQKYNSLTSITIPASLQNIGVNAFIGCHNVSEFINVGLEPLPATAGTFSGIILETCTVRVPETSVSQYQDDRWGWGLFANIVAIEAGLSFDREEIYMFLNGTAVTEIISATVTGITPFIIAWSSSDTNIATVDHSGNVTIVNSGTSVITGSIGSIEASYTLIAMTHGAVDGQISWGIHDESLYIFGAGPIPDYNPAPWVIHKNLFSTVVIDEGITGIGNAAFNNCNGVTSVSIPATVTTIGNAAFAFCTNLTSVNISSSVNFIGEEAFVGCEALSSILVDEDNQAYSSDDSGVLFNKNKTTLIAYPGGKSGSYTIPGTVETIGKSAFKYCGFLTAVIIPASVTTIGDLVFFYCSNLSKIINLSITPQTIVSYSVFASVAANCILIVPDVERYKNAQYWGFNMMALDVEISLDGEEFYLLMGNTEWITVTVTGDVTDPGLISWSSSHENIAAVDQTGFITAVSSGTTVVTASIGITKVTCMVTVVEVSEGTASIVGTVHYEDTENVRINLYMKVTGKSSQVKKGIAGGYVLLATVIPNNNGEYSFGNLPEGFYKVEVEIGDNISESSEEITLSEGETCQGINFVVDRSTGAITRLFTTGMAELPGADVKIYPNPFTDAVHITGAFADTQRAASLRVINTSGTTVHTQIITNPVEIIHMEHLSAGMYIFCIENNGRITATFKVVKQ